MKFCTDNIRVVRQRQFMFGFNLPGVQLNERKKKFVDKYGKIISDLRSLEFTMLTLALLRRGWFPPPPRLFTNFLGIFLSFSDALLDSCRGSFCTHLDVLYAIFAVTVN